MKPGFGKKKAKQKKGKKKGKKAAEAEGEAEMADAELDVQLPTGRSRGRSSPAAASEPTAKERQQQRMQLKKALKVQIGTLKNKRGKLTKLAGNKTERRQLNQQIQGLLQEQLLGKGQQQGGAACGAAGAQGMAE